MKALDFTKKKSKLVDKLVKLGFHYQSTDKEPSRYDAPIPRPCTRRQPGEKTGDHVAHRFHMRTVSLQIKGLSAGPLTNGGIHCLRLNE